MNATPHTEAMRLANQLEEQGLMIIPKKQVDDLCTENAKLREDKARLDWLLSRCSVGTHVLGHKGQSHFAFQPFFTLRVQGGGREGIDDAMLNAEAIAAIERQLDDAERRGDEHHAIYDEPGGGPFSGKSDD